MVQSLGDVIVSLFLSCFGERVCPFSLATWVSGEGLPNSGPEEKKNQHPPYRVPLPQQSVVD
jgi:hypothetical protein